MSGVYSINAENRQGLMNGSMTLAEMEAACATARALGCGDDAVPTTLNQPVMSSHGGPIVMLSFELPERRERTESTTASAVREDRPEIEP